MEVSVSGFGSQWRFHFAFASEENPDAWRDEELYHLFCNWLTQRGIAHTINTTTPEREVTICLGKWSGEFSQIVCRCKACVAKVKAEILRLVAEEQAKEGINYCQMRIRTVITPDGKRVEGLEPMSGPGLDPIKAERRTKMEEGPGSKATPDEICDQALAHYQSVSGGCSPWSSTIPKAIEFYRQHLKEGKDGPECPEDAPIKVEGGKKMEEWNLTTIAKSIGRAEGACQLPKFFIWAVGQAGIADVKLEIGARSGKDARLYIYASLEEDDKHTKAVSADFALNRFGLQAALEWLEHRILGLEQDCCRKARELKKDAQNKVRYGIPAGGYMGPTVCPHPTSERLGGYTRKLAEHQAASKTCNKCGKELKETD